MAQVTEVAVPDIGEFTDVPIIEILVAEGDAVDVDSPLVTLESDKATMEIPAPVAGVVEKLLVQLGDKVSEGSPIARIAAGNGAPEPAGAEPGPSGAADAPTAAPDSDTPAVAPPSDAPVPREQGLTDRQTGDSRDQRVPQSKGLSDRQTGDMPADGGAPAAAPPAPVLSDADAPPAYASPLARRAARELGVDLARVLGSGRKGRIVREDVEAAAAAAPAGGAGAGLPGMAPWPTVDFARYGEIERVPLSRIKKISGPNLARNWVMIPHVTHHDEADITELEAFRKQVNAEHPETKVTMVALLVKAVVASLKEFPHFNASLDGDELVLRRYWNIGFAADTPHGLMVPVIHGADSKGLLEIADDLRTLSGKAREGKLLPTEMQGATFTISSLGGIGGTGFTPIINAPEVAILGVTRAATKPVWNGSEFEPRLMVPLSLSYDHRVIDGADAARFTAHLAQALTDLRRVLL